MDVFQLRKDRGSCQPTAAALPKTPSLEPPMPSTHEVFNQPPALTGHDVADDPAMLRAQDRSGNRVDEVEFHPAWHELMTVAVRHGLHAAPWRDTRPGAHVARAAGFYVWGAADAGHCCPVSMT